MNAVSKCISAPDLALSAPATIPSDSDFEAALRLVLKWIGEDPTRDGLLETPARVRRAFKEYFSGYAINPATILEKTFAEIHGYDEMVMLRGIPFHSHCEHHLAPIVGSVWVAYLPDQRVVGISKLARLVEVYARRLQIQERMTAQIADTIEQVLRPKGVAVLVRATHHCISARGVNQHGVDIVTKRMIGLFRDDITTRQEFLRLVESGTSPGL